MTGKERIVCAAFLYLQSSRSLQQPCTPTGTSVAHKTGTSGYEDGIAGATSDVALVTLPAGRRFALVAFAPDAHANETAVEATIATIALACFEAAVQATP